MKISEKLNNKKSNQVLSNLTKFINQDFKRIQSKPKTEMSKIIHDFISEQTDLFCKIWGIDQIESYQTYNDVIDSLEKNIMGNLYNKLFCSTSIEIEEDFKFDNHLQSLGFLTFKNHEISPKSFNDSYMSLAIDRKFICFL